MADPVPLKRVEALVVKERGQGAVRCRVTGQRRHQVGDAGLDQFGIVGDGINSIIEALRKRQDRIRYIGVRHEEAAAFMASGYAKHTGRTYEEVERTLDRDHFMDAQEAKDWGLVDHIYDSRAASEAAAG